MVSKYSIYWTSKIAWILTHMQLMIQIVLFWIEQCTFWTKMYAILGFTVFQKEYKIWTVNFSSIFHWNFVLLSLWKIELLTSVYHTGFSIKVECLVKKNNSDFYYPVVVCCHTITSFFKFSAILTGAHMVTRKMKMKCTQCTLSSKINILLCHL